MRMIAVIFEGWTDPDHCAEYLDLAAQLRPLLDGVPGFISVERFRSLADPEKLLSLSFWEDEAAIAAWRTMPEHRAAQARGRAGVFRDYRIRIAAVSRDYTLADRVAAPADSRAG
ncbi:antibiotic biosynthesis monooxygenase [Sphingomonas sp.]|uniref:antibiotic biosynthesis monooxygenase family protein n=1 Tax=Sphingomonas sp. TaxID=28214 RepID=UPI002DB9370A|nr:antibiotic biosynthesis monooxygenase [Sphingomonas sp.]